MSDEMLLQNILDRLTMLDSKIDGIKEDIHAQNVNEQEQNSRLERIEARMGSFEAFQTTVTTQLDELKKACGPQTVADEDTEISQGINAFIHKMVKNPKILWPIIAILIAMGVIDKTKALQFFGIATPAAVVAPEVIQ